MNAKDEMFAKSKQLKKEVEEKKGTEEKAMVAAKNSLDVIKQNKGLAEMYGNSAGMGTENLGSNMPVLKIHTAGKSQNELANGEEPENGSFFYQPTAEAFKEVECHILTISRGFKAPGMNDAGLKFNQIIAGAIIQEGKYLPFYMYFTGKRLRALWDFGKEVSKYTRSKSFAVPLFALRVKLSTVKEKNEQYGGYSWLIKFDVAKHEDGTPVLIDNPQVFNALRSNIDKVNGTIQSLIDAKEAGVVTDEPPAELGGEASSVDQIPF